MKVIQSLLLLLVITNSVFAQKSEARRNLYQSKIESYTKLKKAGNTIGIVGGGLTLMGVALATSANWETTTDEYGFQTVNTNTSGAIGVLSICFGVPLAITGIVLNSNGKRKVAEYTKKLENIDVGYYEQGLQKGLTLAIRF